MKTYHLYLFVSLLLIAFGCKKEPLCNFPERLQAPEGFQITELARINNSSEYLYIQFIDAKNGVMLGDNNSLMTTKDGGHSWTKTPIIDSLHATDLLFVDTNNGYIPLYSEKKALLTKTIDGGQTWETIEYPFDGKIIQILAEDDILFAILRKNDQYKLLKSTDHAISWNQINDFSFHNSSLVKIKDGKIYIVGYPNILICNTSGHLIKKIDVNISLISSFYIFDEKNMIIGNNNKILKSSDLGDNWIDISQDKESQQIIHFFDNDNGIVLTGEDCSLSDSFIVGYSMDKTSKGGDQWIAGETFDPTNYSFEVGVAIKDKDHIILIEEKSENQIIILHEIQRK